ncbi:sigma-54 interaction domain-containing protein [Clostridium oceanicum]|uniref:Sigma 54-interacting transcriptional regulator n=1 Tax=Clostridium oceanicum TaxID=1543 RepID=A0ABP3UJ56_9CLOT
MKKKLLLITVEPSTRDKYLKELNYFFKDHLEIEGYSIKEGINGLIEGDLALITSLLLTNIAKKHLPKNTKIIYMTRTFSHNSLKELYNLPQNTKAMFVTNESISAIESIATLYELGLTNIEFIPVYPNMENIPNLKIAVTPGQLNYMPSSVENIINIGWKVLDLSTLMDIGTKLDIMNEELEEKFILYADTIMPISHGLHSTFASTSRIKNLMNTVLDIVDNGVIITDRNYKIVHYNESVKKMFSTNRKKSEDFKYYKDIIPKEFWDKILKEEIVENVFMESFEIHKSFLVTKRTINLYKRINGYVILVKDITDIQNLENKLRKQLIEKGYVAKYKFKDISGTSKVLLECINKAKKIAKIDAPALIMGESGTGKELFAQSIHNVSKRSTRPFVAINCAALPSTLLESELFGYEEGSFTGAKKGGKRGLFELAHTGTIFLDEIGDVPINVQVKLLRILQEKEVMRVGGSNIIPVDVRVIAATNQDLKGLIEKGTFRMDLYYRLNVLGLHLPPLRDRKEDIKCLIKDILDELGYSNKKIDDNVMNILLNYSWKGNVRELRNCVEYMAYMGGDLLTKDDLPEDIKSVSLNTETSTIKCFVFDDLLYTDRKIAFYILNLLNNKSCGRRAIYQNAIAEGQNISEHDVRKIMTYLNEKDLIIYGKGRSGAKLTNKGREILKHY